jgi:peroxiredoxin
MRFTGKHNGPALPIAALVCWAAVVSASEPETLEAPLPEVTTAQLIVAIRESAQQYEAGRLEADFEEAQDADAFSADKNAKPNRLIWPGRFSYASDGRRWRAGYQGKQINRSLRGPYLGPYEWSAGFDGDVHYLSDHQGWVIGEEHGTARTLSPIELFWPQAESLLDGMPDPKLRITGQDVVDGSPCYVLEYRRDDDTLVSKRHIAPRRSYLELRYQQYYRGKLTTAYELGELAQTADGAWFPRRLNFEWRHLKDDSRSTVFLRRATRVTKFEPGRAFADDEFKPQLPFGEVVRDRTTGLAWYNDPWWPDLIELAQERSWPPSDFTPLAQMDCYGEKAVDSVAAPPLEVAKWINSDPLDLKRLRGKVVLLHFFGGRLIQPLPERFAALRALRHQWRSAGLEVVAVATAASKQDDVRQLAKELHLTFPIAVDSPDEKSSGKTFSAYGLASYTGTFVIDADGLVHRARGNSFLRDVAQFLQAAGATDLPAVSTEYVHLSGKIFGEIGTAWEVAVKKSPFNGTINGKVTDGHHPIPRAEITARLRLKMLSTTHPFASALYLFRDRDFSTVADQSGEYELAGLPKGTYEVTYVADGMAVIADEVTIGPSLSSVTKNVALEQADGIDGHVLDASGEPVSGAVVTIRLRHPYLWLPEASSTAGLPEGPAVTDLEGRFRFTGLHVGGFTFDVTSDGYTTETFENVAAGTHGVEVRLQAKAKD